MLRDVVANETFGELGSAFGGTLVWVSLLRIPTFKSSEHFTCTHLEHMLHW